MRPLPIRQLTIAVAVATLTSLAAASGALAQAAGASGGTSGSGGNGETGGRISSPQPLLMTNPGTPPDQRRRPRRRPRQPSENDCGYHIVKRGAASVYIWTCRREYGE